MNVVVVGGGVVGLFTAYFLSREKADVTMVEQESCCTRSSVAAGIIEPHRLELMNNVKYIIRFLKLMRRGAAVVRDLDLRWIMRLLRSLGRRPPERLWDRVAWMFEFTMSTYRELAEARNDFEFKVTDMLELVESRRLLKTALEEFERTGIKYDVVEVKGFAGGFLVHNIGILNTDALCKRVMSELKDVKIVRDRAVRVRLDGTVRLESGGEVKDDQVVVTSGFETSRLVERTYVPVAPFKGYAMRARLSVERPTLLVDYGMAIVPLREYTKITWGFDLDRSRGIDVRRVEWALSTLRRLGYDVREHEVIGCGHRPCTPTGFPIVVRASRSVVIATGSCRLGFSQAPAIGKMACDLVMERGEEISFL